MLTGASGGRGTPGPPVADIEELAESVFQQLWLLPLDQLKERMLKSIEQIVQHSEVTTEEVATSNNLQSTQAATEQMDLAEKCSQLRINSQALQEEVRRQMNASVAVPREQRLKMAIELKERLLLTSREVDADEQYSTDFIQRKFLSPRESELYETVRLLREEIDEMRKTMTSSQAAHQTRRNVKRECKGCEEQNISDQCEHCFKCGEAGHFSRGCRGPKRLTVKPDGMSVNTQTSTHSQQHTAFRGKAEEEVYERLCERIRQLEA
ncbi:hypothetical protein CRENBAI_007954 [Crenichthys baileyi]|uniref:CCHC-type domain-containing protein n=1 Tax=Crenichthys baileyi TaxID=28760 RepID=A0AAV9QM51_9TELE